MNRDPKTYENTYCAIEQTSTGEWNVWNKVTGLLVKENVSYPAARACMIEMKQHYLPIERKFR